MNAITTVPCTREGTSEDTSALMKTHVQFVHFMFNKDDDPHVLMHHSFSASNFICAVFAAGHLRLRWLNQREA